MAKLHLYWYSLHRKDQKDNYGDALGPFIAEKLSGKSIKRVAYVKSKKYQYIYKQYFTVGSIIKRASSNSIVWGSGIIKSDELVAKAKFCAVRGPRTRARLISLGYEVPEVYGDPALLLPKFISNEAPKKYKIGLIPHFMDYQVVSEQFQNVNNVKVVDLITSDIIKTTKEIQECTTIISSSLHGVIVAHAYNIPALWVKFSDKLSGDNIKFYDYFESVSLKYEKELTINIGAATTDDLLELVTTNFDKLLPTREIIELRQHQLLESCPFKLVDIN